MISRWSRRLSWARLWCVFFACPAHVVDVGGCGFGADGKSVYEEGIQIPIMKFAERGVVNTDLVKILRTNVRDPNQVVGDFDSLAACNDVGHRRLIAMMQEIGLTSLDDLGTFIFTRTRAAILKRIAALPQGRWTNELVIDGYDQPVKLVAAVKRGAEASTSTSLAATGSAAGASTCR